MSAEDLRFADLQALAAALADGQIDSAGLTRACLAHIERLNATAHAFITVMGEAALTAAHAADRRRRANDAGTLCGVPFAAKDLFDVAGVATTGGSRVLYDNVATQDAAVIERMAAAGAVCVGKTNLHEFAYGATGENPVFGTPRNPYDPARLAGGSSSGSAVAVALGLVPAAFGTDTGGSVRAPAALTGLVGLKPTIGRVSTRGVIPYCWSLDHVGWITRTVADAALLLDTVAGHDPRDPGSADVPVENAGAALEHGVRGLRIGVPRSFYYERADPEVLAGAERALAHLEACGATCTEVELPAMDRARTVSLTLQMPEALSFHMRYLDDRAHLYGEDFRAGLALGQCLLAEHYVRARRMVTWYREQTEALFAHVDALVTPTAPVLAPSANERSVTVDGQSESVGNAITRYTTFFNLSGHPAISVPAGRSRNGLPIGVQVIGPHFHEPLVLRAARAIELNATFRVPPPVLE